MDIEVSFCIVCGISETDTFKMHNFPLDTERSTIWQRNLGLLISYDDLQKYKICSRHFTQESFINDDELSEFAVPILTGNRLSKICCIVNGCYFYKPRVRITLPSNSQKRKLWLKNVYREDLFYTNVTRIILCRNHYMEMKRFNDAEE